MRRDIVTIPCHGSSAPPARQRQQAELADIDASSDRLSKPRQHRNHLHGDVGGGRELAEPRRAIGGIDKVTGDQRAGAAVLRQEPGLIRRRLVTDAAAQAGKRLADLLDAGNAGCGPTPAIVR